MLKLIRDLSRDIKRGHPWVYRSALKTPLPQKTGVYSLLDKKGQFLARGIFEKDSPLAFRVVSFKRSQNLDSEFLINRIHESLQGRSQFSSGSTNGFRLLNGEGDGLPGLICDVYSDVAVLQTDGQQLDQVWDLHLLSEILTDSKIVKFVVSKPQKKKGPAIWLGDSPEESKIQFSENGIQWTSQVIDGQKTGFFLDQRNSREWIRGQALNAEVLNLFSYSGGFSVSAGVGGAQSVTSVDISTSAIELAEAHWALNELVPSKHNGIAMDVFDYLTQQEQKFDIVIVDPPSFAPSQASVKNAIQSYVHIFSQAATKVKPGGLLALSSCSSHINFEIFYDICIESISKARRRGRVKTVQGQPEDHPFPLACPELRYLKFFALQLN